MKSLNVWLFGEKEIGIGNTIFYYGSYALWALITLVIIF